MGVVNPGSRFAHPRAGVSAPFGGGWRWALEVQGGRGGRGEPGALRDTQPTMGGRGLAGVVGGGWWVAGSLEGERSGERRAKRPQPRRTIRFCHFRLAYRNHFSYQSPLTTHPNQKNHNQIQKQPYPRSLPRFCLLLARLRARIRRRQN
jgi:hypothetical protein